MIGSKIRDKDGVAASVTSKPPFRRSITLTILVGLLRPDRRVFTPARQDRNVLSEGAI